MNALKRKSYKLSYIKFFNNLSSLSFRKGFTLIELLVVIAIIGILASVILASLNGARSKATDKAIMSDLTNFRNEAEIFASDNKNSYGANTGTAFTYCYLDNTLVNLTVFGRGSANQLQTGGAYDDALQNSTIIADANTKAGGGINGSNRLTAAHCVGNSTYWAVAVQLVSDKTQAWCVDSEGNSVQLAVGGWINTWQFPGSGGGIAGTSCQ